MTMMKPSPAQLSDRAGIIWRKIVEAEWEKRPSEHWLQEYREIWKELGNRLALASPMVAEWSGFWPLFLKLFATNNALWEAENDIRRAESEIGYTLLSQKIIGLNDSRAGLMLAIDRLFSPETPEEKLH